MADPVMADPVMAAPLMAAPLVAEPLAAAGAVVWRWSGGRLRFDGDLTPTGLGALAPDCRLDALLALAAPRDRHAIQAAFTAPPAGEAGFEMTVHARGGRRSLWRGAWTREGEIIGVILPDGRPEGGRDPLTGLLSRAGFLAAAAGLAPTQTPLTLLIADLVRFRRLNEALGPERADDLLCVLAARLAAAFASTTLPARVGDDEFALLVDNREGEAQATLRTALEAPVQIDGLDIHPRFAIGAAAVDPQAAPAEWLRAAGLALERARGGAVEDTSGSGASQTGVASTQGRSMLSAGALSRLALESDVRMALERGEIEAFFQPVVRLDNQRVAGFEALARWRHPRLGLMHPDEFLNALGEAGLMPQLGLVMIETAAAQLAAWRARHPRAGDIGMAVNVTCGDLEQPGVVERVGSVVARHALPPGALKLELTESEIMRDPDAAAEVMRALKAVGVSTAVDDFGMGFSSLSYLARLPLETLKIDRYFVRTMGVNEGSAKIVRSVVALARDLGLQIVAEGVENVAMAKALADIGCHCGQGYGYARPLPALEAEVYLNESYLDRAPLSVTAVV